MFDEVRAAVFFFSFGSVLSTECVHLLAVCLVVERHNNAGHKYGIGREIEARSRPEFVAVDPKRLDVFPLIECTASVAPRASSFT